MHKIQSNKSYDISSSFLDKWDTHCPVYMVRLPLEHQKEVSA